MARPVIALLTDFGLIDHYVAAMKGVMLAICPDAALIDISHDIPPQDILAGALELEAVVPYLPDGTVVLGVIDPGVGTERRGIALDVDGRRFVGPDNGLFSLVGAPQQAVELTERKYGSTSTSLTFEGRDRFAPAAAWLAAGVGLSQFGPAIDRLARLDVPEPALAAGAIDGIVLRVDRFGNLVTNIRGESVRALSSPVGIAVAGVTIDGVSATYADVPPGALCGLVGSTNRLEISVNGGSAATVLAASRGTRVQVRGRRAA